MENKLIFAALAQVMERVGVVRKSKKNQQQGYDFRGVDDVVANVQQVMAECGVICVPRVIERERELIETKNGGRMASVRLLVEHVFYAKDGSSVVCTTLGEAMDSGDKASNKAMSAALKYALTETLLIPTYEAEKDTEEHSPEMKAPQVAPPASPPKVHRMPIKDVPESLESLRAAIAQAKDEATLTVVAARIGARQQQDRDALRPVYLARLAELTARKEVRS